LARTGHGAMADLSPLSGEERKSDFGAVRSVDDPEQTLGLSSATNRAGDALGQCEIPLGPNWLFRLNRQRGVQLGHSSYKCAVMAASDPPQS
jgi:hypothetical protein